MHVYLTGATGFVGEYVLAELMRQGHTVRCLLRNKEAPLPVADPTRIERVKGDVTLEKSVSGTMRGCDAVIHLVGIIEENRAHGITFDRIHREGAVHVIDEARRNDIDRFILMSANGARPNGVSPYQTTKWEAEQYLRESGIRAPVIFRPSVIFGDPGSRHPEFASQLAATLVRPFPILPIFGDGSFEMQPVSVEEVAAAFVQALTSETASSQVYAAVGKVRYPFTEVLDLIARGMGLSPKPKIPQPLWLIRPVIHTVGKLGLLPITPDQFEMLVEGNTGDSTAFYRDFDLVYRPFTPENLDYLRK